VLDLAFRPRLAAGEPVYRQLAAHLVEWIETGRLRPGERIPPSRELAASLGLSRNTVNRALERLAADGLLEAHVGRGTFVAARAPRLRLAAQGAAPAAARPFAWQALLAERARALRPPAGARPPATPLRFDFRAGRVDAGGLPIAELQRTWQRALAGLREHASDLDALGHAPLREAVARSLGARGIACGAGDVLITAGAQQGLDLVARALLEPGDTVALEQPGWFGAALAFRASGADLLPIAVDGSGLRVDELARALRTRRPKLVYVTPASQLPTGVALSESRRDALLALSEAEQLPVLEDDFDSELRLAGPARPALKTRDPGDQVIYLGTFSKALFPGLRIGYVVAARSLLPRLSLLRMAASQQPSLVDQMALAELLAGDALEKHVRRVRRRHAERVRALLGALAASLPEGVRFREPAGGSSVWVELPAALDVRALAADGAARGLAWSPGEAFHFDGEGPPALLLSFGALDPETIREGVGELAGLVRRSLGAREARSSRA
jgi:GntR family transcriptional regulator/MocR family aminotransferase